VPGVPQCERGGRGLRQHAKTFACTKAASTASAPSSARAAGRTEQLKEIVSRTIRSHSLICQVSPAKAGVLQYIDIESTRGSVDEAQSELFKKAYASMGAADALAVVRRCFGEETSDALISCAEAVQRLENDVPELAATNKSTAAEDAICRMHLENACRRVDASVRSKEYLSRLYLGEYSEIRNKFAGRLDVTTADVVAFFRDDPAGRSFWIAFCAHIGVPPRPYDSDLYQIEHVLNKAWGGADHYLNYCVLLRVLNNCAEFKYGPGEVKLALLGRHKYAFVQRFARWNTVVRGSAPRDAFLRIESECYALPAVSLTGKAAGKRQLFLSECTGKKFSKR